MSFSVDAGLAKRLATHYAPEFRFDSREQFFPCSIDWLAAHSSVWCETWWDREIRRTKDGKVSVKSSSSKDKKWIIDCQVAGVGETTDPKTACSGRCDLGREGDIIATKHQHRLRPIESEWEGQSEQEMERFEVPCYYSVVPAPCNIFDDNGCDDVADGVYEITYYMIYAYNGSVFNVCGLGSPIQVGIHEGDLEQVVIYVKDPETLNNKEGDNDCILAQFQFRHSGEGRFCEPKIVSAMGPGCHFVVYPACEGHASYSKPGWTCRIFGFANDRHDGKGRKWQTWKNLQAIDKAKGQPKWIDFDGRYGGIDGLAQRSDLGRPGFPSWTCTLPAMLPHNILRAKLGSARKQIPQRLIEAVNKKQGSSVNHHHHHRHRQQQKEKRT